MAHLEIFPEPSCAFFKINVVRCLVPLIAAMLVSDPRSQQLPRPLQEGQHLLIIFGTLNFPSATLGLQKLACAACRTGSLRPTFTQRSP